MRSWHLRSPARRPWRAFVALTLALTLTAVSAQEEPAQEPEQEAQVFQDWRVQCQQAAEGQRERCYMFQNLVYRESGQTVLSLQIGRTSAGGEPVAVFILPLGVILPPGLRMEIDDGAPTELDYQQCNQQGCIARLPLAEPMVDALKQGLEANVTFEAFVEGQRQPVTVPVSLKGFTAAFDATR